MTKIATALKGYQDKGLNKTLIMGMLKHEGFTKKEIDTLNIQSTNKRALDKRAIMQTIIDDNGQTPRKQLAESLEGLGLCTKSTGYHVLSLLDFCEEYHQIKSGN